MAYERDELIVTSFLVSFSLSLSFSLSSLYLAINAYRMSLIERDYARNGNGIQIELRRE